MTGKTGASPNLTTFRSKSVTSGIHTDISQTSKLVQPDAHSPTKNSNCFSTPQTKWQEQFKPAAGREPSAHTETRSSSKPSTPRSEEHTSELQSRFDLVCRLLLEKKKINCT